MVCRYTQPFWTRLHPAQILLYKATQIRLPTGRKVLKHVLKVILQHVLCTCGFESHPRRQYHLLSARAVRKQKRFAEMYNTAVSPKVHPQRHNRARSNEDWFAVFSYKEREGMLEYTSLCCFVLLLWNTLSFNQLTVRPLLPIMTFDIVAFAFTLLSDNLSRNSCVRFSSISLSFRSEFINDNTLASKLGSYRILSQALTLILILVYFRKF